MIGWMSRLSDAQENILKKHAALIHCLHYAPCPHTQKSASFLSVASQRIVSAARQTEITARPDQSYILSEA